MIMPKELATREEYEALVNDHPEKFYASQVNFERGADRADREDGRCCGNCFHFYRGMVHNVCEIFRPADGYDSVDPLDICDFWSSDGEIFPLLREE